MKKIYFALFAFLLVQAANAQLNYLPGLVVTGTSTYTPIGTNGSAITVANNDDANSATQPIGFTFSYNGQSFTNFIFNTNGFIKLGTTAPGSAAIFGTTNQDATGGILLMPAASYPANGNSIAVFNHDLIGSATATYRVYTSGAAPNRVCTIEWNDVTEKTTTPSAVQFSSMDFQIKLYETSNLIDFVFANFTATTNTDAFRTYNMGLVGTNNTGNNVLYVRKGSTSAWSAVSFENAGSVTTQIFNLRRTVAPDNGRTYRFFQALQNDVTVNNIYALGKTGQNTGSVVRARITNNGLTTKTNLVTTLQIRGANSRSVTATIPSLITGASTVVSFPGIAVGNLGYDTLVVSVPTDDFPDDNTDTTNWNVTTNEIGYSLGTTPEGTVNIGANGILAAKLTVPYPNTISQIKFYTAAGGNGYDALIYNNSGAGGTPGATPLWTLTGQATVAGLNTVPVPNIAINDTFYVAIRQTGAAIGMGFLVEAPLRPNSFYLFTSPGPWFDLSGNATNTFRVMIDAVTTAALPVKLSNFAGKMEGSDALLNWSTVTELNSSGFNIERSDDGNSFTGIGLVAAKGNSTTIQNYAFADRQVRNNVNYYRLQMVDKDGKFQYSPIIKLTKTVKNGFEITIINPSKGKVFFRVDTESAEKVAVSLYTLSGQLVAARTSDITTGSNSLTIGENLSKGTYIIKISKKGETPSSHKVIIE